jgi:hypothetical protein
VDRFSSESTAARYGQFGSFHCVSDDPRPPPEAAASPSSNPSCSNTPPPEARQGKVRYYRSMGTVCLIRARLLKGRGDRVGEL